MKTGILEPDAFSPDVLVRLRRLGPVSLCKGPAEKFIADKEILFVRLGIALNREFLSHAGKLKIICTPTTGLNHIDTDYCREKGIRIVSLKGETSFLRSIRATPEHTLGLILALRRNYARAFMNSERKVWDRDPHRGYEIFNSNIGIIGLGRVGKLLSGFLKPLGAVVSYYDTDLSVKGKGLIRHNSADELIRKCDTVVLSCSYDPSVKEVIGKKQIDAMKGKYFINTARAELTDEAYLVSKALKGHFKGIAVDVIQHEQTDRRNLASWLKAADLHNVIVTPHIGGATFTSMSRTEDFITDKLSDLLGMKI